MLHQFDKNGINSTTQWQTSIRDLERIKEPKKEQKEYPSGKDNSGNTLTRIGGGFMSSTDPNFKHYKSPTK